MPSTIKQLREIERQNFTDMEFMTKTCPVSIPKSDSGHPMIACQNVELVHYDFMDVCIKLVQLDEHKPYLHFYYEHQKTLNGDEPDENGKARLITELWTADWWREQQLHNTPGGNGALFVPMLSTDETVVTMTGRKWQPVYAFVGNYHCWFRQQNTGWALLGFLPVIRAIKAFQDHPLVLEYRRLTKKWGISQLFESVIQKKNGFPLSIQNKDGSIHTSLFVYPRFPLFVGDEVELNHSMVGAFGSTNSKRPCTICDVCPKEQGLTHVGNQRKLRQMRKLIYEPKVEILYHDDKGCKRTLSS
jgi:hypothetical protein